MAPRCRRDKGWAPRLGLGPPSAPPASFPSPPGLGPENSRWGCGESQRPAHPWLLSAAILSAAHVGFRGPRVIMRHGRHPQTYHMAGSARVQVRVGTLPRPGETFLEARSEEKRQLEDHSLSWCIWEAQGPERGRKGPRTHSSEWLNQAGLSDLAHLRHKVPLPEATGRFKSQVCHLGAV